MPPCEVDLIPWGTLVHNLETTEYKFYPQLTPGYTDREKKNVIWLPLHRNVKDGLLWYTKGQKQSRTAPQAPPSNFHWPLREMCKTSKQGYDLRESQTCPSLEETILQ